MMGGYMIYICVKCKFLFERKNEPSKCPCCENQCVVGANTVERQTFKELHGDELCGSQDDVDNLFSTISNEPK